MNNNHHLITRIASIVIGSIIAIAILVLGFQLLQGVFTRASDIEPRDVIVSDISQNNVKVSWTTGEETQGVIEYGTSPTALNFFAPENQKTKIHAVDLTLLSPSTTYYFQVRIADKKYDNGGVPWTFTTKGTEKSPSPTVVPRVTSRPTPVQSIAIPQEDEAPAAQVCNETDCTKIKDKLGKGCTTSDYFKCLQKPTQSVTSSPTVAP